MDWLLRAGEIAAAILAITGAIALLRSKVIRPVKAAGKRAIDILEQLLDAARFARQVASELREFSGAFTMFAVGIKEQVDANSERLDRLEEIPQMLIDLEADVARIRKTQRGEGDGK